MSVTAFFPPASCSTLWWGRLTGDTGNALRQGLSCVQPDGVMVWDSNCFPSTTQPITAGCPVGWNTVVSGAMQAGCCPSSYAFIGGGCVVEVSTLTTITNLVCLPNNPIPSTSTQNFSTSIKFYGRPVYLTYASPSPTSSSLVMTSKSSGKESDLAPASRSNAISASNTSSALPEPPSPVFSKGAIAGTVVGVLIFIALVGICIFLVLRRRKNKQVGQPRADTGSLYIDTKPELDGTSTCVEADHGCVTKNKDLAHLAYNNPGGIPALRPTQTSPEPPSELSAAPDINTIYSHPASLLKQLADHPSHDHGDHSHHPTSGEEMVTGTAVTPEHVDNSGPCYSQANGIAAEQARVTRLAELEALQRDLEDKLARMRYVSAIEEEYGRTQAEIARLRNGQV